MTTEAKKNIDYSNSAVNLTNHEQIKGMLQALAETKAFLKSVEDRIEALIPKELADLQQQYQDEIMQIMSDIQITIEERGSYQDLENGRYAVKQRKVSKSYDARVFKIAYPQYSPAVVIETIDTTKLNGLIKGGLITEADLKTNGVVTEKETFNYIIKV
jgi:hypothetical protein